MRDDLNLKELKKRLEDRLQVLSEAAEGRKGEEAPRELDQTRVGRLSRMDAMQQQAMSKAATRLEAVELQRIKTALGRLASEEYGYCILCDEEIAAKRLDFDPSLLICISCAEEAEKK